MEYISRRGRNGLILAVRGSFGRKLCFGRYTETDNICRYVSTVITAEISAVITAVNPNGRTLIYIFMKDLFTVGVKTLSATIAI